ncbi:SRPBCC family protein [Streptomyces sp. NPDC005141]
MDRHWHPLAESGDKFLTSTTFRYSNSVETGASVGRIWEVLTGEELVHWVRVFTGLRWRSPRPFGVGTVRDVTLLRVFTVRERFFRWEEEHRYTFSVLAASAPGLRRAAEDWIVEATPTGSRLTWTMAIEAVPLVTPLLWISGPAIRLVKRRALHSIRTHVSN